MVRRRSLLCTVAASFLAIAVTFLAGCGLRLGNPHRLLLGGTTMAEAQPACISLQHRELGLNLGAIAAGVLGGGASTASGFISNEIARYALGGASALLSGVGAILTYLGGVAAATYTRRCE